jgi:hypothetical protein
LKILNKSK